MDLGDRIRARRKEMRLSLRDLAGRAGLSFSFLSDVERNKRRIGADNLLHVAQVLGLSMDTLMVESPIGSLSAGEIALPAGLTRWALGVDVNMRTLLVLHQIGRVIASYRRKDVDEIDWARLYEAVQQFLS